MESVKCGSGQYFKIIMRNRTKMTQHTPGPWRKKLEDLSITNMDIKQMKVNLHSIPSNELYKHTQLKLGRTQIGMTAKHAGTAEDPWCKKCKNRGHNEIETSLLHCFYSCPSSKRLISTTIGYFSKETLSLRLKINNEYKNPNT